MESEPQSAKKPKLQVLQDAKNRPTTTRANRRAKTMALVKQVEEMLALMEPHKKEAVQVLVDQLKATRNVYHQGILVDTVPDQKIRQDAAKLLLEWLEGKPRELQVRVTGKPDDFADMLRRFRGSDEFQRVAPESLQKTVQGKEIKPSAPPATIEDSKHPDEENPHESKETG